VLSVALSILAVTVSADAAGSEAASSKEAQVVWRTQLGEGAAWYRLQDVAVDDEGRLWTAAIADPPPDSVDPQDPSQLRNELWIWRTGPDGQPLTNTVLNKPEKGAGGKARDTAVTHRARLAPAASGALRLAVDFTSGDPWWVSVKPGGEQSAATPVQHEGDAGLLIRTIIRTTDGGYVVSGYENGTAILQKHDAGGAQVWRQVRKDRPENVRVRGAAGSDGGFVLVESASPLVDAGEGMRDRLWIGRFNADGTLAAGNRIDGRNADIAALQGGDFVLVRDTGTGPNLVFHVTRLNAALEPVWSTEVVSMPAGMTEFEIVSDPSAKGCAIVGGKEDKPFVAYVAADGTPGWTFWGESMLESAFYHGAFVEGGVAVASTVYVQEGDTYRGVVRLFKVAG